jgi:hypothetical protein
MLGPPLDLGGFDEALAELRSVGDRPGRAEVLEPLGRLAAIQRDVASVRIRYAENLAVWCELGEWLEEAVARLRRRTSVGTLAAAP